MTLTPHEIETDALGGQRVEGASSLEGGKKKDGGERGIRRASQEVERIKLSMRAAEKERERETGYAVPNSLYVIISSMNGI